MSNAKKLIKQVVEGKSPSSVLEATPGAKKEKPINWLKIESKCIALAKKYAKKLEEDRYNGWLAEDISEDIASVIPFDANATDEYDEVEERAINRVLYLIGQNLTIAYKSSAKPLK